ncbi:MAG: hypothetical protein DRJ10_08575 [Bacteroidetes bacterium]|nr:MAG: hypothetical protein DRJ10_08575 [Bacteroidota bacterium]
MEKLEKYGNRTIQFLIISALLMILLHLSTQVLDLNDNNSPETDYKPQKQDTIPKLEQDNIWKNTEFSDD